ncbi:tRNA(Ile)-lysidine synthase [Rhodocyclaceae bacterium]|nr:tRNA(Ile)-lysidine synthase [Rhodocyclaceae bacterium]
MENSRKSNSRVLLEHVGAALLPVVPAGSSILLGLSGGVDSVVLLHLLQQLSPRHSWRLSALHVHHGISPRADAWAAFCADLCARIGVPLHIEHVDITPLRDLGIEAAARKLRHAALARQQADFVALAHHQDDQVETMLLQLLRGAGVRGASAMPLVKKNTSQSSFLRRRESSLINRLDSRRRGNDNLDFPGDKSHPAILLRPLLDTPRSVLLDYAQRHALQWVEDESNADDAYPRNFLRHRILPLLEQRFPAYRDTLSRSARHFAEAATLLDDLAEQDAAVALQGESLDVSQLHTLDAARGKNLLRYFLAAQRAPIPDSTCLEEMLRQLCCARNDAAVNLTFGGWQVRRYQERAYAFPELPGDDAGFCVQWRGEAVLELPELGGVLHFESCVGQGLSSEKLQQATVSLRLRHGAERIRPDNKRPTRTLKNLLQEQGMPPWQRDSLPLLYCGEELVCAPGVAAASAWQAQAGEAGLLVSWHRRK